MPGARFEHDFTDEAGNLLVGNVTVQVARENGGPVQCYSDRELTTGLGSTFVNDGGKVAFFAAGGALRVTVTQGAFSRTLHYYALGLAAESDFTFAQNAGVWSSLTTYARGEYVVRNGVGIFISTQDGNLNHTPDSATPGSTTYWTYYPGLAGPAGVIGDWRGPWVTATAYVVNDAVSQGGSSYLCVTAHTSGVFATDLGAGKWQVVAAKGDTGAPGATGAAGSNGTNGTNGTNGVDGKFSGTEVIKTAAYTALAADVGKTIILNKATADVLSFAAAATLGSTWMAMVKNIGAGTWTLDPNGAELIDGSTTVSLAQNESVVVSCNGTALRIFFRGSAAFTQFTAASASAPAKMDFAEQTTNGTNKTTVQAAAALGADNVVTLPAVTGTVPTGPTTTTDNTLPRFDGTAGALQTSGVVVDDSNNVTGVAALTLSGLLTTNGQVKFPATVNLSSDANTLDDYEEGTFTPGISFGGGTTGITYSNQQGSYTKIGNRVLYDLRLILSSKGSSTGAALITGLPFVSNFWGVSVWNYFFNMSGVASVPTGYVDNGQSYIFVTNSSATGSASTLSNTNFANNSDMIISGNYRTAA